MDLNDGSRIIEIMLWEFSSSLTPYQREFLKHNQKHYDLQEWTRFKQSNPAIVISEKGESNRVTIQSQPVLPTYVSNSPIESMDGNQKVVKDLRQRFRNPVYPLTVNMEGSDPYITFSQQYGGYFASASQRIPASSRGDSLEAPSVNELNNGPSPRNSFQQGTHLQSTDVQHLMLPPLQISPLFPTPPLSPPISHTLLSSSHIRTPIHPPPILIPQSLEQDTKMNASTLELFYDGGLESYDSLKSTKILSHLPTQQNTITYDQKIASQIVIQQSGPYYSDVALIQPNQDKSNENLHLPPLGTINSTMYDNGTMGLHCVLEQKNDDDCFMDHILQEQEEMNEEVYFDQAVSPVLSYASPHLQSQSQSQSQSQFQSQSHSYRSVITPSAIPSLQLFTQSMSVNNDTQLRPVINDTQLRQVMKEPVHFQPIIDYTNHQSEPYVTITKQQQHSSSVLSFTEACLTVRSAVNAADYNFSEDDLDTSDNEKVDRNSSITQLSYHNSARTSQLFRENDKVHIIPHKRTDSELQRELDVQLERRVREMDNT